MHLNTAEVEALVNEIMSKMKDGKAPAASYNAGKGPLFNTEERVALIRPNIASLPNVSVTAFDGLLVDFALAQKATAIIRGLRALSDFEFEFNMALMNRHLQPAIETLFVMPRGAYSFTSSNLVKQVAQYNGDVSHFVPDNVGVALKQAYKV